MGDTAYKDLHNLASALLFRLSLWVFFFFFPFPKSCVSRHNCLTSVPFTCNISSYQAFPYNFSAVRTSSRPYPPACSPASHASGSSLDVTSSKQPFLLQLLDSEKNCQTQHSLPREVTKPSVPVERQMPIYNFQLVRQKPTFPSGVLCVWHFHGTVTICYFAFWLYIHAQLLYKISYKWCSREANQTSVQRSQ